MAIVLGTNRYGKSENRVVRINKDTDRHEIRDMNVSTSLYGDFDEAHAVGDQANILPTDTQKNTAFVFAKTVGVNSIEEYAQALGKHFLEAAPPATRSQIRVQEYAWDRIVVDGQEHDHSFVRRGTETRTAVVTVEGRGDDQQVWVLSGMEDLTVLKSSGSEFQGYLKDEYTTLKETTDRVMATSLTARWRWSDTEGVDFNAVYDSVKALCLAAFARHYSKALQNTLFVMGQDVLEAHPQIAEIRFSAPNKHHFDYDLGQFGLENNNEVFIAADRPYGLIEAAVTRDDATDAGPAWQDARSFV